MVAFFNGAVEGEGDETTKPSHTLTSIDGSNTWKNGPVKQMVLLKINHRLSNNKRATGG